MASDCLPHQVPHPSVVHLEPSARGLPWRSEHARPLLVAGAFGVQHGGRDVVALRLALQRACDRASEPICKFHRLGDKGSEKGSEPGSEKASLGAVREPAWHSISRVHASAPHGAPLSPQVREPAWHSISRLYWGATFCLQPPGDAVLSRHSPPSMHVLTTTPSLPTGDAVSRKAIVDSLVLGCIPVLFHRGQAEQWPWHWGAWHENASVLIDSNEVVRGRLDPIAHLRAIPTEHVRTMQRTIGAHGHRMQYAAVDTALLDATLLSRSATATVADDRAVTDAITEEKASRLPGTALPDTALPDTALPDAFDIALSRAWERATDRSTIEAGRRTQRVEGAALEAGLDSFDLEPKFGSWGGPNTGTCMRTWGFPGDCERAGAGTWVLGFGSRDDISPHGLWSLDDCSERCRRCARCRWIASECL